MSWPNASNEQWAAPLELNFEFSVDECIIGMVEKLSKNMTLTRFVLFIVDKYFICILRNRFNDVLVLSIINIWLVCDLLWKKILGF